MIFFFPFHPHQVKTNDTEIVLITVEEVSITHPAQYLALSPLWIL